MASKINFDIDSILQGMKINYTFGDLISDAFINGDSYFFSNAEEHYHFDDFINLVKEKTGKSEDEILEDESLMNGIGAVMDDYDRSAQESDFSYKVNSHIKDIPGFSNYTYRGKPVDSIWEADGFDIDAEKFAHEQDKQERSYIIETILGNKYISEIVSDKYAEEFKKFIDDEETKYQELFEKLYPDEDADMDKAFTVYVDRIYEIIEKTDKDLLAPGYKDDNELLSPLGKEDDFESIIYDATVENDLIKDFDVEHWSRYSSPTPDFKFDNSLWSEIEDMAENYK